jgi:hypothetical protein
MRRFHVLLKKDLDRERITGIGNSSMSIIDLTSSSLKSLISLTKKKEILLDEIKKIESQVASFLTGKPSPVKKGKGRPAKKVSPVKKGPKASEGVVKSPGAKRGPKGGLGKKVIAALEAAGEEGVKVSDLARKLKVKNTNLHVWFSSTGKKNHPEIKKAGKGLYKLEKK